MQGSLMFSFSEKEDRQSHLEPKVISICSAKQAGGKTLPMKSR